VTTLFKRIAIGAAVLGAVAVAGYYWAPTRIAFAAVSGGMGQMMQGNHMQNVAQMMQGGHMQNMGQMHTTMTAMHEKELNAVAEALGMTPAELTEALKAGRGVADLAKEKNVDTAALKDTLAGIRQAALDELVAAGTMTREQADLMLQHMGSADFLTLTGGVMMQSGGGGCPMHGSADDYKI